LGRCRIQIPQLAPIASEAMGRRLPNGPNELFEIQNGDGGGLRWITI
jgi:hypothetical protein